MTQAVEGFNNLKENVDTLITIPNDKILTIIDKKTPMKDAFSVADDILTNGVQGVSDLITRPGLINVDFADVRSVMENAGSALMGIGYGSGENRAIDAARQAIESPLLELSINGAKGLLLNITGGNDLSMFEVDEASRMITDSCDPSANIIFGTSIDEAYTGEIKITVIATGFSEESNAQSVKNGFGQSRIFGGVPPVGNNTVNHNTQNTPANNSYNQESHGGFARTNTTTHTNNHINHTPQVQHNPQPQVQQPTQPNPQNDMEIPAFLRNRMGR